MKKIQLNKQGEYLLPHSSAMDGEGLTRALGKHEFCNGWMHTAQVSETHQVLYCKHCNFRMLIPLEVDTWKKLEAHMSV